jgi:TonB family protein
MIRRVIISVFRSIALLIPLLLVHCTPLWGQKTFLNKAYKECDSSIASYYQLIHPLENDRDAGTISIYRMDGTIRTVKEYSSLEKKILQGKYVNYNDTGRIMSTFTYDRDTLNGPFFRYHDNGQLHAKGLYRKQALHDSLYSFYPSGNLRRRDLYRDGELLSGNCFIESGADTTHFVFEKDAEFPGGLQTMAKWIQENVVYPQEAIEFGEQGRVYVSFVVESSGSISTIEIERGVSETLDKEVKRLINAMPDWIPGEIDGYKERTKLRLPVNFQLDGFGDFSAQDTVALEANYNWKIGTTLIDPYSDKVIVHELDAAGKKFKLYYRDPDTYKLVKVRLTRPGIQELRALKFSSRKSCKRWHWFNKYP